MSFLDAICWKTIHVEVKHGNILPTNIVVQKIDLPENIEKSSGRTLIND